MSDNVENELLALNRTIKVDKVFLPILDDLPDKIDKNVARKLEDIDIDKVVLLFFGLIRDYKGLDVVLNSLKLLGRPFTYSGKVVYGNQLGAQLGIPTANLWLPKNKLPISGVYIVKSFLGNKEFKGIANMGIRPTIGGESPVLEVHLLNFSENIYGKKLTVEFIKKVREEKKFKNLDALKDQIFKDISTAESYFV